MKHLVIKKIENFTIYIVSFAKCDHWLIESTVYCNQKIKTQIKSYVTDVQLTFYYNNNN